MALQDSPPPPSLRSSSFSAVEGSPERSRRSDQEQQDQQQQHLANGLHNAQPSNDRWQELEDRVLGPLLSLYGHNEHGRDGSNERLTNGYH